MYGRGEKILLYILDDTYYDALLNHIVITLPIYYSIKITLSPDTLISPKAPCLSQLCPSLMNLNPFGTGGLDMAMNIIS